MRKNMSSGEEHLRKLKHLCFKNRIKMVWSRPMAIGTYKVLKELLGNQISSKHLYTALCCHANSPAYLKCLTFKNDRLLPGGKKEGKVTQDEAHHAKEALQKQHQKALRSKKIAAKIAEKRAKKALKDKQIGGLNARTSITNSLSRADKPKVSVRKKRTFKLVKES